MVPPHYTIEPEWQSTARVRTDLRRFTEAREGPNEPQFDAAALTAALGLTAKPIPSGVARKVRGTYPILYDVLVARIRRRNRVIALE